MFETVYIKEEPLDVKEEYDYRSDASSDDDEQGKIKHGKCDIIKEKPLRVKEEGCTESNDVAYVRCNICQQYIGAQELAAHRYAHTSDVTYTCLLCHRTYTNMAGLRRHFNTTHFDIKRKQIATDSSEYNRTHTAEKLYECSICHKRFNQKSYLTIRHMRTHTGEKPYECNICHKQFIQKGSLKIHMRTHTGEKPYECNICHKHFSRNYNIQSHMRTHTGEKPYECDICYKRFSQMTNLTKHKSKTHAI